MGSTQNLYPNIYGSLLEGRKCEFECLEADAEAKLILPKSWTTALASELMSKEEGWAGKSRTGEKHVLRVWHKCCVTMWQWVRPKDCLDKPSLSESIPVTMTSPCYSLLSDNSANHSWKFHLNDIILKHEACMLLWAINMRINERQVQHLLRYYCSVLPLCFAQGKEREPTSELPMMTSKNYSRQSELEQF